MSYVYLDISINYDFKGRVVIELFEEKAPLAAENFKKLCESKEYAKTFIHRVIRTFILQAGDTSIRDNNNNNEENSNKYPELYNLGKNGNGTSIYNNEYFKDENLIDIDKPFLVCMSNFGEKNHNKSQFFFTLEKCLHLNGKHTVFGNIKFGKSIIREIEKVEVLSNKNSEKNAWIPSHKILIDDCGIWNENDPLPNKIACTDQIGGDIYEEYPDDNDIENLDFENADQSFRITTIIKDSATSLLKLKRYNDCILKYKKALRYCNELLPDDESNKEMYKKFQNLKMTIYLNLSLATLLLNDYDECINYCGFILQMEDIDLTNVQASKIFYRLGKSYEALKKYDVAYETLQKGAILNPQDNSIKQELAIVEKIVKDAKQEERAKYAKFFS
jgi:peptidylprolyl isomerase